ncbi:PREDICTED: uncharacterized protein LOC108568676 [Nicrophorus vespilloides]|uniref:Uncharacterized protein LOC108568676 n=1 Tax=Nicrophorus vespilloides TaxID=110193 RepID=A0ABM1NEX0_NICVS|nr:PREDICTED: uncharacterized protein LOC108568676 [Nicrophorus vespilloides]
MSGAVQSRGLVALFKRGWNEIPEVIGSTFMGIIGIGLSMGGLYTYYKKDGDYNKYKLEYTVIRHDDPLANRLQKVTRTV